MKKVFCKIVSIVIALLICFNIGQASFASDNNYIEKSGVLLAKIPSSKVDGKIQLVGKTDKDKIKILMKKDNVQRWFDIKLDQGNFLEELWLTDGKGSYTLSIMVHVKDRQYIYGPEISVNNTSEPNKYLVPSKHVESNDASIIKLAEEITMEKTSDTDKAQAIYQWVVDNIQYDYDKLLKQDNQDYSSLYGAVNTLHTKKGVCYDYAALTAALGRAIGLQVKVVKGQGITDVFKGLHAWNEVYISEDNKWIPLDTTFAATSKKDYFANKEFDKDHIKEDEY
ncbi:MAG: transglutaminase-like enzyme predicted cysteine protease [Anaerosolibacter sp.]|jgi:transglutaminase-like putative cysteine protease|uniref:transglutaminase-like domain-containing protein n=1 Tax=Anaerosolibacter sp. TaxID=1872527 RepID=UPI002615FACF|nr:transglutaminase-like domain-containing protein [Anaerosolibacter sp.]MDF2548839.1 transglutaminase-like enzyme predicted cysteine protease [Anaerosolibacter sp.]